MAKKEIYDCSNMRYLFDFSLLPSIVFNNGLEFSLAVCETEGKLLFDILQDYYENMIPDIKRKGIKLFDPRRIKAHCVKLNNGWNICCIQMPDDINGSSPIFCNAYFIAIKVKEEKKKEKPQPEQKKRIVVEKEEYDDGYDSEDTPAEQEIKEINTERPYYIRFFTVEEATNREDIISLPIYKGIKFNRRVLCEIFEDNKRKEYCETEKDITINLIKVAKILDAIDESTFVSKTENQEKDEVSGDEETVKEELNDDVVETATEKEEYAPPEELTTNTTISNQNPEENIVSNTVETPINTVTEETKESIVVEEKTLKNDFTDNKSSEPVKKETKQEKSSVDENEDVFSGIEKIFGFDNNTEDEFAKMERQFKEQNEIPNPYANNSDNVDTENN